METVPYEIIFPYQIVLMVDIKTEAASNYGIATTVNEKKRKSNIRTHILEKEKYIHRSVIVCDFLLHAGNTEYGLHCLRITTRPTTTSRLASTSSTIRITFQGS